MAQCKCGQPVSHGFNDWMRSCRTCLLAENGTRYPNNGNFPRRWFTYHAHEQGPDIILTETITEQWGNASETPFSTNVYRYQPIA